MFITTRPSEDPHSKSLIHLDSRNVPVYSQGMPYFHYKIDKSINSGSEIIEPSDRGLKGFLQTYFKGRKKGADIFNKFVRKRKTNMSYEKSQTQSQGVKGRKIKHYSNYIYF